MKKTFGKKALVVLVIVMTGTFMLLMMAGCGNGTTKKVEPLNAVVNFVPMVAGETINFSPDAPLPEGVTYVLTDDKGHTWNSTGFNGKITAADYYVGVDSEVTFTQTFYYNGEKITGAGSKELW